MKIAFNNGLATALGCMLLAVVSGCATTPGGGSRVEATPEQKQLRQQARAYNKTVLQGAAAGAIAGGAVAALRGGDRRDLVTGAAIGGVVGGVAGAYYANKQRSYASQEALLDGLIEDARVRNSETSELIVIAQAVHQQQNMRLNEMKAQYARGEIEQRSLQQQINIASEDRDLLQESVRVAHQEKQKFDESRALYLADNPNADVSAFDSEVTQIADRIRELERITNQLTDDIDAASIG